MERKRKNCEGSIRKKVLVHERSRKRKEKQEEDAEGENKRRNSDKNI